MHKEKNDEIPLRYGLPYPLLGSEVLRVINVTSLLALFYVCFYSFAEYGKYNFFFYYTEIFSEFADYVTAFSPGAEKILDAVLFAGYEHRVPYVTHLLSFTIAYSLAAIVLHVFLLKMILKRVRKVEVHKYGYRWTIWCIGIVLFSGGMCIYTFYEGLTVQKSLKGGFEPHIENVRISMLSVMLVYSAQVAWTTLLFTLVTIAQILKKKKHRV